MVGNGTSIHVRRWVAFFAGRGHEVHVAILGSGDLAIEGARVHGLGRPPGAALRLRSLRRRLGVEVLHAHYLTHYGWLAWASFIRPYAVTLWGSDILVDPRRSRIANLWARLVLAGATCVTGDSEEILDAAARLGVRRARAHLIQFGVDTVRFAPGGPTTALDLLELGGRRVVLSPRAVAPLYRTHILVEALATLPADVVLVATLAGSDPRYVERVRAAAERLGVGTRLRLVEPIPHGAMDELYRGAEVVASVPATDGTPVSVLEALACGVPVVATDLPAVRPWIAPLDERLLVPVDDAAATSEALAYALELAPARRRELADAGRRIVIQEADQATNMLRMERLYLDMAANERDA